MRHDDRDSLSESYGGVMCSSLCRPQRGAAGSERGVMPHLACGVFSWEEIGAALFAAEEREAVSLFT